MLSLHARVTAARDGRLFTPTRVHCVVKLSEASLRSQTLSDALGCFQKPKVNPVNALCNVQVRHRLGKQLGYEGRAVLSDCAAAGRDRPQDRAGVVPPSAYTVLVLP